MRINLPLIFAATVMFYSFTCFGSQKESINVDIESPGITEVSSKSEHFKIYISGTIKKEKYDIPKEVNIDDFNIFIFVNPLGTSSWWRQEPSPAQTNWDSQAFLGGKREYSAKNGERFRIIAILSKERLSDKYNDYRRILKIPNTYKISKLKTVVTLRH